MQMLPVSEYPTATMQMLPGSEYPTATMQMLPGSTTLHLTSQAMSTAKPTLFQFSSYVMQVKRERMGRIKGAKYIAGRLLPRILL
jgi:hypothetical protein